MSTSLTWQELPEWLQKPLLEGAISLAEASEIWDLTLLSEEEWVSVPRHLYPAAGRLKLWQMSTSPTRH